MTKEKRMQIAMLIIYLIGSLLFAAGSGIGLYMALQK